MLCEPSADPAWQPTADEADPITSYQTTLEHLQRDFERFETQVTDETRSLDRQQCSLKFSSAHNEVDELYSVLCTPTDAPPRTDTDSHQQGDGRWLEYQLSNSLQRWGYRTQRREEIYGLEVDVIARAIPNTTIPPTGSLPSVKTGRADPSLQM